jgi:hypothetical protein
VLFDRLIWCHVQSLLANFSDGAGRRQIHVMDKTSGRCYLAAIRNVAAENYFNTVQIGSSRINYEPLFDEIDSLTGTLLKKVVANSSLAHLTKDELVSLAAVTAIQIVRTKLHRITPTDMIRQLKSRLLKQGLSESDVSAMSLSDKKRQEKVPRCSLFSLLMSHGLQLVDSAYWARRG